MADDRTEHPVQLSQEALDVIRTRAPEIARSVIDARKAREAVPGYQYHGDMVHYHNAQDLNTLCNLAAIASPDRMASYTEQGYHRVEVTNAVLRGERRTYELQVVPVEHGVRILARDLKAVNRVGSYTAYLSGWPEGESPVSGADRDYLGENKGFGWRTLMSDAVTSVATELGYVSQP